MGDWVDGGVCGWLGGQVGELVDGWIDGNGFDSLHALRLF